MAAKEEESHTDDELHLFEKPRYSLRDFLFVSGLNH